MSNERYLTLGEFKALHDEEDLLAVCGLGGYNSASGRVLNEGKLYEYMGRAQSLIDGYLLSRFPQLKTLPVEQMPQALKGAASDLIIYWLRDRVGDQGGVDDVVKSRYTDAIRFLKDVRERKADLGLPALSTTPTKSSVQGSFPESRSASAWEGLL
ncbi:phage protein Gp36 family protein [Flexibacterium corallicola]|uniref:phage protein Gp36 family protein n=1 Tax=Flexibacterium corallicola TaxID=3037259 RepID=UPI00286EED1E|nr:phage protein Gp36 family protein [Pseudovibrio sp. M1P-2-3]